MAINMLFNDNMMNEITDVIAKGALTALGVDGITLVEANEFSGSEKKKNMDLGELYYMNKNKVFNKTRSEEIRSGSYNLADNNIKHPFMKELVDQKVSFLVGKPVVANSDNEHYSEAWSKLMGNMFDRTLKSIGKEAVNKGIGWLHVYYDENGNFSLKKMRSQEIIPLWKDEQHTILDAVIRDYKVIVYEGQLKKTARKLQYWNEYGVYHFVENGSSLLVDIEAGGDANGFIPHFLASYEVDEEIDGEVKRVGKEQGLGWGKVPFIGFKYNEEEQPLIEFLKSLVDDYNTQKSINSNNLEDLPNSLYVIQGFEGTSAAEARHIMNKHRVVMIGEGIAGGKSGVETVSIDIDTEAYKLHMEQTKRDIYNFGRGVDTQGKEIGTAASGVALKFMYSSLVLDASMMELEFQASLTALKYFFDLHLYNTEGVDYSEEKIEFVFNKDMPIDEESIIKSIKESVGILSMETLVANHPYTTDVKDELDRKAKEEKSSIDSALGGMFNDDRGHEEAGKQNDTEDM